MAAPSIISITPSTVPSIGGSMVEVLGSNFALPAEPDPTGITSVPSPSVRVTFGGRPARRVIVVSSQRLFAVVPSSPGLPASFPVVLTNLDSAGDPISGESVTRIGGITYERVKLDAATSPALDWVVRILRRELSYGIVENVAHSQHTDWTDTPAVLTGLSIAHLPALAIVGPRVTENRFYSLNELPEVPVEGNANLEFVQTQVPFTVDLTFDLIGICDASAVALKLLDLTLQWFHSNKWLEVPETIGTETSDRVRFELDWARVPSWRAQPNNSNIRVFEGELVIRGLDLTPAGDAHVTGVISRSRPLVDEPELESGVPGDGRTPPTPSSTFATDPGPFESPYQIGAVDDVGSSSNQ